MNAPDSIYREARKAQMAEDLRKECAQALTSIADAIHSPSISRAYLMEAQRRITLALTFATLLDAE